MKKLYCLIVVFLVLSVNKSFSSVFIVNSLASTNTGAGTSGTLRYCIDQANQSLGPHTINFAVAGTIAISTYANLLPELLQPITIDGTTAPGFSGAPVVIIKGTIGTSGYYGIRIAAANCSLYGLEVSTFPYWGIWVEADTAKNFIIGAAGKGNVIRGNGYEGIVIDSADNGIIAYNKIGTDYNGSINAGNGYNGILLEYDADNNSITNNQISYNGKRGIDLNRGSHNQITNNFIGTNVTATINQGNTYDGIALENGSNDNYIGCNTSSCNHYNGIYLYGSNNNVIQGNVLGALSTTCAGNLYSGIQLFRGSSNNLVGGSSSTQFNKITGNHYWGIDLQDSTTLGNVLTGNSYCCNYRIGIINITKASNSITAPVFGLISGSVVFGTSLPNSVIEIFKSQKTNAALCPGNPADQGTDFIGTTTADASGNWSLNGSFNGWITATQRDPAGNTSAFTVPVYTGIAGTLVNNCTNAFTSVCGLNPVANFQSSNSHICTTDCINFTDMSSGVPTSWLWTFTGATPSSGTSQNPQGICYFNVGTFDVSLTVSNSGGSDTYTLPNFIHVIASPSAPGINHVNDTILNFTSDSSYVSYQWYRNNVLIAGATDTFLVITQSGNYNVEITNANGCKIAAGINIVLGLQNYMHDPVALLSPNPVKDKFTVYGLPFTVVQAEVYNVLGQVCRQSEITNRKSEIDFDVSSFVPGVYFVHVLGEKERWVGRFVKE